MGALNYQAGWSLGERLLPSWVKRRLPTTTESLLSSGYATTWIATEWPTSPSNGWEPPDVRGLPMGSKKGVGQHMRNWRD